MPTARPFAYNTGSTLSGTVQYGNIAVLTGNTRPGGVDWWNGPDEDLGYVIATQNTSGNQPNPVGVPAYLNFFRTTGKSSSLFNQLASYVAGQNFPNTYSSTTYLLANGRWTSYNIPNLIPNYVNPPTIWNVNECKDVIVNLSNSGYTSSSGQTRVSINAINAWVLNFSGSQTTAIDVSGNTVSVQNSDWTFSTRSVGPVLIFWDFTTSVSLNPLETLKFAVQFCSPNVATNRSLNTSKSSTDNFNGGDPENNGISLPIQSV